MVNKALHTISRRQFLLFATMGLILVVMNILLVLQNKTLKRSFESSNRQLETRPGTMLPKIRGTGLDGNQLTISYGEDPRKTLLLVFSPKCGACVKNMPNWQSLVRKVDSNSYRVIAASLVGFGVNEYLKPYDLGDLPVIAEVDPADRVSYNLALTPQMILIDSDGRAEMAWTGVLNDEKKADVERTLNIRLDGAN